MAVKHIKMYNPQLVVGNFFEEKIARMFGLARQDSFAEGKKPDLKAEDCSFVVEVKASAYNNGGVIKGNQLLRFSEDESSKRFYAFAYHSITESMTEKYPSEDELREVLDLRSLYIIPFSIVKAFYEAKNPRKYGTKNDFVQIRENMAHSIFTGKPQIWKTLNLPDGDYKRWFSENIYVITRKGALEEKIKRLMV